MIKIVFSDQDIFKDYIPYLDSLAPLDGLAHVMAYNELPCSDEERYERMKDADVIVFGVYKFKNDFLGRLKKLRMLQFMGTGYSNFADPEYCARAGIILTGTENYGDNAVAEFAIAQAFTLARNTALADRNMRSGRWIYDDLEGTEISGCTFGVLGTGNIGRLVAQKAHALGANVLACDVYESEELKRSCGIPYVGIDELFKKSDILSLHVRYTKETGNLVSSTLIGQMKKNALLINCSRAEIVDYEALQNALSSKKIKGAALDVFYEEPLSDFSICKLSNVITSPHIGFFTGKAKGNCLRMCVDSIVKNMKL